MLKFYQKPRSTTWKRKAWSSVEQTCQNGAVQFREAFNHECGSRHLKGLHRVVADMANRHRSHATSGRRLYSSNRVFHHHTARWIHAEPLGPDQENLWVWLATRGIFHSNGGAEILAYIG